MEKYNPFTVAGKTIFITGASSGIGQSVAIECSKLGAKVIITGRNKERLEKTFRNLIGTNHQQIIADLTVKEDINNVVGALPCVDGIVHCAGIAEPLPFQFLDESKLKRVLDINFTSPSILTQQLLKARKINKSASIVFISSISGVYCSAIGSSSYSASKGAINGLAKGMALDLAPKLIRVNCVNPGMVKTDLFADGTISEDQLNEDMSNYPLKRYGQPEEIAYAVIYLLSDASKWVTGSNLLIDGGYTLL